MGKLITIFSKMSPGDRIMSIVGFFCFISALSTGVILITQPSSPGEIFVASLGIIFIVMVYTWFVLSVLDHS